MSFHEDSIWCECPACVSPIGEIDRLRAELAESQAMRAKWLDWCDIAKATDASLRAEIVDTAANALVLDRELGKAEAAIARVREWAETYIYADHDRDSFLRALDGGTE